MQSSIAMDAINTIIIFAANTVTFIIDIPYYIYLLLEALIISVAKCFRWKRKSLEGENILVTGAASGMGQQVVVKLAQKFPSAVYVLWDINEKGLSDTEKKCRDLGADKVYSFMVDLSNRKDVAQNAALVRRQVGQVSILFNNAGLTGIAKFLEADPDTEERVVRVNLLSYMWTIREFLPGMVKSGSGHLVSTCSGIGFHRFQTLTSYCASKYGLRGFLESLKLEMREHPSKPDIKFSTIYPGFVRTPMAEGLTWEPRYNIKSLQYVELDEAADEIVEGILKEKEEIFFPSSLRQLKWIHEMLPSDYLNAMEKYLLRNFKYNGIPLTTANDGEYVSLAQ